MHTDPEVIDRVKRAVADTIAAELGAPGKPLGEAILHAIDAAIADPADPREFIPGRRVRIKRGGSAEGVVVRVLAHQGDVHTVVVRLDDINTEAPYSPRILEVIA